MTSPTDPTKISLGQEQRGGLTSKELIVLIMAAVADEAKAAEAAEAPTKKVGTID